MVKLPQTNFAHLEQHDAQLLGEVRCIGNAANHAFEGNHRGALSALQITWQLSLWFHRAFKNTSFKSGLFIPLISSKNQSEELRTEMARLSKTLEEYQATYHETSERLEAIEGGQERADILGADGCCADRLEARYAAAPALLERIRTQCDEQAIIRSKRELRGATV